MELKHIAQGWLKDALKEIPAGQWVLIADGYTDYYSWYIGAGSQKEVEAAYTSQGGRVALTYLVTDGIPRMVRPKQVICPKCKVQTNKRFMAGGVCRDCLNLNNRIA